MRSAKRKKNKKLTRGGKQKKTQPTTAAMALYNEKDAVKRLPVDPLTTASTRDSIKIAAELKAPAKSGPIITEPPPIVTATKDIGGERTPNIAVNEGDVFDFGFASQMQLFAKMLQAPLTFLLHQQAVLTQVLLNSRYPKDTGQPK